MDSWKKQFAERLGKVQSVSMKRFDDMLEDVIGPAFDDLALFLGDNGLRTSRPLREQGRGSFKFELAENAYLLVIFKLQNLSDFEYRTEIFAPGAEPQTKKVIARLTDPDMDWAAKQFREGLDQFIDLLTGSRSKQGGSPVSTGVEELVAA